TLNTTVVDFATTPLIVKTGPHAADQVTFDFDGSAGKLVQAAGTVTIGISDFVFLSGSIAVTKRSQSVHLFDKDTGQPVADPVTVDLLSIGASNVNGFVGANGPYWNDVDGDNTINWAFDTGSGNATSRTLDANSNDVTLDGTTYHAGDELPA